VYLHGELEKERNIVKNISTNPEEYDTPSHSSGILSKIAMGLSAVAAIFFIVKLVQCLMNYFSCLNSCCPNNNKYNRAVSG
jgi:hypothetical protein